MDEEWGEGKKVKEVRKGERGNIFSVHSKLCSQYSN